jgi:hypothetical protein
MLEEPKTDCSCFLNISDEPETDSPLEGVLRTTRREEAKSVIGK